QAEDGIRDKLVTGVQTCALPISGTYINHNHFAGLLELTLPFAAACVFYFFQLWSESRRNMVRRRVPASAGSAGVLCVFYSFVLEIGRASCRERVWMRVGGGCVVR